MSKRFEQIVEDVRRERARQDELWGEQNHPDGTGSVWQKQMLADVRKDNAYALQDNKMTWALILLEEVYEVMAEWDPARIEEELDEVIAVAAAWRECLMRKKESK